MDARAHIIVKGMVQGVGFRWFVRSRASRLGLHGYVRNLDNGNVEIEVEGSRSLVESLIAEVRVGPRFADVRDLVVSYKPYEGDLPEFTID
ncbi:MAG: acylphosphatase [Ignavibacteriales bacterium CG07_land_8_20_14_0_80_59_12]|nr:MAG: acylphosphatase [Ignavibacteriales bacterium CG07_land_8_20_14_0_80_59_12]